MLMKHIKIPQYNTTVKLTNKANVKEIAETMAAVARTESKEPYIQKLARELCISKHEPQKTAFVLCNFAYNAATFEPDKDGIQILKTPAALMREKRGNCVGYTILICSLAHAADIPAIIKVVAVKNSPEFGHVYPVINGVACDVVPFQRQDGTEHLYRTGNEIITPTEEEYNKYFLIQV